MVHAHGHGRSHLPPHCRPQSNVHPSHSTIHGSIAYLLVHFGNRSRGGGTCHGRMFLLLRYGQNKRGRDSRNSNNNTRFRLETSNTRNRSPTYPRGRRRKRGILRTTTPPLPKSKGTPPPRHGPRNQNTRQTPVDRTKVPASIAPIPTRPPTPLVEQTPHAQCRRRRQRFASGGGRVRVRAHHGASAGVQCRTRRTERQNSRRIQPEPTCHTEARIRIRRRSRFGSGGGGRGGEWRERDKSGFDEVVVGHSGRVDTHAYGQCEVGERSAVATGDTEYRDA
mmetsp:Transcript_8592/g.13997  ORF Transcript_8592/g.13997 Transcript_8592/m.13997 type:complete len:280 (+) Transcript_8592:119-958(+)